MGKKAAKYRPSTAKRYRDHTLSRHQRGYDSAWDHVRIPYRNAHPLCELCGEAPSAHVDHIIPFDGLEDPLRLDWDNLQALCVPCHMSKTAAEQQKNR